MISKIYNKFRKIKNDVFGDRYYIVYKNHDNRIKTYLIGGINLYKSFGNKEEDRDNAGFRAYCFARKSVRSFRHDRIISLAKKWFLNFLLEISLFGAIIYLSYKIYLLKQETSNAESLNKENQFLKNQYNQSQEYYSKQQKSIEDYRKELEYKEKFLVETNRNLEEKLAEETEKNKKILSQKKSSEVRLGHIAETLAPFLDQFDFEPEQCTFLGQPIDYISFGEEEITFIEVKSGKSQLNPKQKHIKKQVADKLVAWKEIRIKWT